MTLREVILPILSWIGLALLSTSALAQAGVGVSPPRAELSAQPGDDVSGIVTVDNARSNGDLEVDTRLMDAILDSDGSIIWLEPGSHQYSLADWVAVDPLQFELEPAESRRVSYTVSVPSGVPDGTYWGVMFFETRSGQQTESSGIGIQTRVRVGHIIYVHVGQPAPSGRIAGLRHHEGQVVVSFENTGTALLRLEGHLEVRDTSGVLLQTLVFEDVASLPGATHDIAVELTEDLPPGQFVVLAVLDHGGSDLIAGEARLSVP